MRGWMVSSVVVLYSCCSLANDGPAVGVPAGGIAFQATDAIAMETEDLTIGEDRVSVAYTFRNVTAADVTLKVAFPLPVYRIFEFEDAQPRYRDFTVAVDGQAVAFETLDRAVLCGEEVDRISPAPVRGPLEETRDVTAVLAQYGLPVWDYEKLYDALDGLSAADQKALEAEGVITIFDEHPIPQWCIKTIFSWDQTFPAGTVTKVAHTYSPQTAYFNEWHLEPWYTREYLNEAGDIDRIPTFGSPEFMKEGGDFLKAFDVDASIQQWAATQVSEGRRFGFGVVHYILTTGALWSGPIQRFTLTLEKPAPYAPLNPGDSTERIVVSTDFPGLEKTGERTFSVTKENFTPERDLSVLFIHAYPGE